MRGIVVASLVSTFMMAMIACQSTDSSIGVHTAPFISEVPARFAGHARLKQRAARMPVVLDLAAIPGEPFHYQGFMRVTSGGFGSHEYVTLHFHDVRLDPATGKVTFDDGPKDMRVTHARLVGTFFRAQLEVLKEGVTLPIELSSSGFAPSFQNLKVTSQLTGHYSGTCASKPETLQLEASRWRGLINSDTTAFGGYRVYGRRGHLDGAVCGDKLQSCVAETFPAVQVHFFAQTVKLSKDYPPCKIQGHQIRCENNCNYQRDLTSAKSSQDVATDSKVQTREFHVPIDEVPDTQGRAGQYYGHIHHENSGSYQLLALNVRAAPEISLSAGAPRKGDYVVAVATLYFGEGDSSEFIAYKFKETVASAGPSTLIFEGDGEAVFVVDDWRGKTLKGTWYGKSFGRVGTVELAKSLVPALGDGAVTVKGISGRYVGDDWEFELGASANLSEQSSAFYPIKIFGWARERLDSSRRHSIQDGIFDFYTGAIALKLDDGRIVLGKVGPDSMDLNWVPLPRLGAPITMANSKKFLRTTETTLPQAKNSPSKELSAPPPMLIPFH